MPDRELHPADPRANYLAHAAEIRDAIDRVLASGRYILGPEVEAFEREFAAYLGVGDAIGVANGTEALELALRSVGVGRGDLVVTVANTVSATASAIDQIDAHLRFVDIDPVTMTMSPTALAAALAESTEAVRAIVPVHLYGRPADMPAILEVARRYGAKVVEDCAQAHGAAIGGRKVGGWGDAAAFSFYPTKNLGAIGDGGAVTTSNRATADQVRLLRQYGWRQRYVSDIAGRNSRLDELQAAILRVKLRHLDVENAARRVLAHRYASALSVGSLRLPVEAVGAEVVWHQYTVRTPDREALRAYLAERSIHCGVLYPVPLHRQPAYAVTDAALPETEQACAEVLCLPLHPSLSGDDVDRVCVEIQGWARE